MQFQHVALPIVVSLTLLVVTRPSASDIVVVPDAEWEERTPESLGLDAALLDEFVDRVGGGGCAVKDGYLVKTWGTPGYRRHWGSAVKPILNTLLLLAIEDGLCEGVDAPIEPYVAVVLPGAELLEKDRPITFRHLTSMTSGYSLPEPPGAAWGYNDHAIGLYARILFGGILQEPPNEALGRLAALGFQDAPFFENELSFWASARDFARIGLLWLTRGRWRDGPIVPEAAIARYLRPAVPRDLPRTEGGSNDYLDAYVAGGGTDQTPFGPGIYGFNWWFNGCVGTDGGLAWPDAPPDTFQANGHWGREVVAVMPSLGLVVAAVGNWGTFQPGDPGSSMNTNLRILAEAAGFSPSDLPGDADGDGIADLCQGGLQVPGDANQDGEVDVSDPVAVLLALFAGGPALPCGDAQPDDPGNAALLDWGEDGVVDLSDAILCLNYLLLGGPPHPLSPAGSRCLPIPECPPSPGCP